MKPNPPLISIITPSFNQAEFLERTIVSVLSQNYPNIEYGIIDGKSTDGSLEIIKKFKKDLAWFVSEKDQGQADAINKGFKRVKGEFVAWLNSDDEFQPGAVSAAVRAFENNPEAVIVHGDVLAVDASDKVTNRINYGGWGLPGLMKFQIIGQPAVFMRRSMLNKVGFLDTTYHLLLDHQLWLRLGQMGNIVHIQEPWAKARFHEHAKNRAMADGFGKEAKRIMKWMPTQPGLKQLYKENERAIQAGAYRLSARYLLDADLPNPALSEYFQSLKFHPQTALKEWHRIIYCLFAFAGISKIKKIFLDARSKHYQSKTKI